MRAATRRLFAVAGAAAVHAVVFVIAASVPPSPPAPHSAPARELVELVVVESIATDATAGGAGSDLAPTAPADPVPSPAVSRSPPRARRVATARTTPTAPPQPTPAPPDQPVVEPAPSPEPAALSVDDTGLLTELASDGTASNPEPGCDSAGACDADGIAAMTGGGGTSLGGGGQGGEGAGPGSGGGAAGSDRSLAIVQARLAEAAAGCYPRAAARFRASGVAKVRFCVDENGRAAERQLLEGTGHAMLDDAALGCVLDRAAPLPHVAPCLTVPIQFRVRR